MAKNETPKLNSRDVVKGSGGWNLTGFTHKSDGTLSSNTKEAIRTAYAVESYRLLVEVLKELRGLRRDLKQFRREKV